MGMTIDEIIEYLPAPMSSGSTIIYPEEQKYYEAHDTAVNILRKYQKIEQIFKDIEECPLVEDYALNEIKEVVEDGTNEKTSN